MRLYPLLATLVMIMFSGAVDATVTITRSPAIAPDLGRVIAGTSTSSFRVTTTGTVTRTAGDAIRISNSSVTTPTITINCALADLDLCGVRQMRVTIQPVTGTVPSGVTMFRVGSLTGATFRDGAPAAGASMSFVLNAFGYTSASFRLGMDARLDAGATSGQALFQYTVSVTLL